MLDCQIAILENAIARYLAKNEIPKPMGSRHPSIAPFEAFKTKDSHIIIAAGNEKLFVKLYSLKRVIISLQLEQPQISFLFTVSCVTIVVIPTQSVV